MIGPLPAWRRQADSWAMWNAAWLVIRWAATSPSVLRFVRLRISTLCGESITSGDAPGAASLTRCGRLRSPPTRSSLVGHGCLISAGLLPGAKLVAPLGRADRWQPENPSGRVGRDRQMPQNPHRRVRAGKRQCGPDLVIGQIGRDRVQMKFQIEAGRASTRVRTWLGSSTRSMR